MQWIINFHQANKEKKFSTGDYCAFKILFSPNTFSDTYSLTSGAPAMSLSDCKRISCSCVFSGPVVCFKSSSTTPRISRLRNGKWLSLKTSLLISWILFSKEMKEIKSFLYLDVYVNALWYISKKKKKQVNLQDLIFHRRYWYSQWPGKVSKSSKRFCNSSRK